MEFKSDFPIHMEFEYHWCMPSGDTFSMKPIANLLELMYMGLSDGAVIIDPFARNYMLPEKHSNRLAYLSNDLNKDTSAMFHMDSVAFLQMIEREGLKADLVLFDPPYSPRQMKELYDSVGLSMGQRGAQRCASWKEERDIIAQIIKPKGIIMSFGWNSMGMGKNRGFEKKHLMLLTHGAAHNDTICLTEQKL